MYSVEAKAIDGIVAEYGPCTLNDLRPFAMSDL